MLGTSWKSAIVVLAIGIIGGAVGILPVPIVDVAWNVPALAKNEYVPSARRDAGDELVLVVVGSAGCRWSNDPEFVTLVRRARNAVRGAARQRDIAFATLGVSQDERPERGIDHLSQFGWFDEIAVGRGWRNSALLKYVYEEFPGPAVTPQVLVVARGLVEHGGQWGVRDERVLLRRSGLAAIRTWVANGATLP